jgi:hypothetical protein
MAVAPGHPRPGLAVGQPQIDTGDERSHVMDALDLAAIDRG